MLCALSSYSEEDEQRCGGKGKTLARLFKLGYPVPDGFIIFPEAFSEDGIKPTAWTQVLKHYETLVHDAKNPENKPAKVAVRSSAFVEDSISASFAGAFDSVLNVDSVLNLKEAIHVVFQSIKSARAISYSNVQQVKMDNHIAIIVQLMIDAEQAGVLFTQDPLKKKQDVMSGNLVEGSAEKLVSGEVNPLLFSYRREDGHYSGPDLFKPYASELFDLALRLEKDLSGPQDIEWAVGDNKLFILQSRPITTLDSDDSDYFESVKGDYLWTNTNVGEACGEVLTPLTWSLIKKYDVNSKMLPGKHPVIALIAGRFYINMSVQIALMSKLGLKIEDVLREITPVLGTVPKNVTVAPAMLSAWEVMVSVIKQLVLYVVTFFTEEKAFKFLKEENQAFCHRAMQSIQSCSSASQVVDIFEQHLQDIAKTFELLVINASRFSNCHSKFKQALATAADDEDREILLSGFGGDDQLESLGPLLGISQLAEGKISRDSFYALYGHRCVNEFELATPRPYEDPGWIDDLVSQYNLTKLDVTSLLKEQQVLRDHAWSRLKTDQSKVYAKCKGLFDECSKWAQRRELIRSELARKMALGRTYIQKISALTGIGEDIFFLSIDEVMRLIRDSDQTIKSRILARKRQYEAYKTMPKPPPVLFGEYKPSPQTAVKFDALIEGLPGAAGIVEGRVRVLERVEQGYELLDGEILVAPYTNIGWTPIFPRVSAIVTDNGAPLSHAAIVARELGIPAVVGTGNATTQLVTGDYVRVDGAAGCVEKIVQPADDKVIGVAH